jgi:hypothetical protein
VIENEKINQGDNFSPKEVLDIYGNQPNQVTKQKTGFNTP